MVKTLAVVIPAILVAAGVFVALLIGHMRGGGWTRVGEAPAGGPVQAPGLAKPAPLKVVTFNIQNTWVVGQNRPARMRAIADYMVALDPDVIGFQECFVPDAREILISELKKKTRLQYHQYFASPQVGSGLLVSSAFPIRAAWFHRFKAIASPWKVWEGDGMAGKGVGIARIELPDGGMVDIFNTHTQAGYHNANYDLVRKDEMAEAADFVKRAHCTALPAFFTGDFNSGRNSAEHQLLVSEAHLERVMNVESSIDHVYAVSVPKYRYEVLDSKEIPATVQIDGKPFELSDHNGYITEVRIVPIG